MTRSLRRNGAAAAALIVCCTAAIGAQSGASKLPQRHDPDTNSIVRGSITDSTGHALDSIEVYVLSSGRSARTDMRGQYVIAHLIEGRTQMRARRLGWLAVDTTIVLSARSDVIVNFRMGARAPALDTIRVTSSQDDCAPRKFAGFACRMKAGVGVYRDSAQLAALHPETIADMFDGVPGLRRVGGGVQATTRWTCVTYLINGHPPMSIEGAAYGKPPWVKNVVAVEFYENANTAPEWYKNFTWVGGPHITTPCSLIVYWTRGAR